MHRLALALVVVAACRDGGDNSRPAPAPAPVPAPVHHEDPPVRPFTLTVTPAAPPAAGTPIHLTLELRDPAGARVTDLEVVHEKLLHLIVVSADLSFFTHEHPQHQPDGLLVHDLTLPHSGDYTVFADFTPTGGKNAVATTTLSIAGTAPPAVAPVPAALPATATGDAYAVELRPEAPLSTAGDTMLDFTVHDGKGPVTDLRPYLGAKGHCVIISTDRTRYLHSHPMGGDGATVAFHTRFPAPGVYKIWVELRPRGEPLRVEYTVDVPATAGAAPPAPASGHEHH